jgi:hypothetical protein
MADEPENVQSSIDRMTPGDKRRFYEDLGQFESSGLSAEEYAAEMVAKGWPEELMKRWVQAEPSQLKGAKRELSPAAGQFAGWHAELMKWWVHAEPSQLKETKVEPDQAAGQFVEKGVSSLKKLWAEINTPPPSTDQRQASQNPASGPRPMDQNPGSHGFPPPVIPPSQGAHGVQRKKSVQDPVRYAATLFGVEAGCQNAGTWNHQTIARYCDLLNQFADKGWNFMRLDVIPFSSGCWPFMQKGSVYLVTFQSR